MGEREEEVDASPSEIRKAITKARSDLGAHLDALHPLNLIGLGESPGEPEMPTTKNSSAPKGGKTAAKKSTAGKSEAENAVSKRKGSGGGAKASAKEKSSQNGSNRAAKHRPAKKAEGVMAKAGDVLDTMAAGAVVGAVKAAARSIDENKIQGFKGGAKKAASTADVLGDLAPGLAMGAVVGAAETVLPVEQKRKPESPKKAKASKKGR